MASYARSYTSSVKSDMGESREDIAMDKVRTSSSTRSYTGKDLKSDYPRTGNTAELEKTCMRSSKS